MTSESRSAERPRNAAPARPSLRRSLIMFLSVVGPGIITANADNDVGGITTYSLAGAQFGYDLLWLLLPVTLVLIITQEICARMGAVTGKGLADLIRENFGVRVTFWVLVVFVISDLGNIATEFAGIASVSPILQTYVPVLSKYLLVPLAGIFVYAAIVRGNQKIVERIFFIFCAVYLAYVVSGFLAHPNWAVALPATIVPPHLSASKAYLIMAIGVIGTTVAPWQQFYIQAAVVEKGIRIKDYPLTRLDVIVGSFFCDFIAYFIIIASAATIFAFNQQHLAHPIQINSAGDVAVALTPLAGKYASLLFSLGLLNAAIFTASVLPLSTAYYVCEAFGFEAGIENRFRDAKFFYLFYLTLIAIGAGFVLIPNAPLLGVIFYSQVLNGILLAPILVFMLLLVNNRRLMGKHVNGLVYNVLAWATVVIVATLTLISVAETAFPKLGS
jgi:Mn2+/Fe2+ NRAMP family transporter